LIDTEHFTISNYIKQTKIGIKELFKNEYIKYFSIYYSIVGGFTWYFVYFLGQTFASYVGFDPGQKGVIFSAIFLIGALFNIYVVKSKWFTREKVYLLFPILMSLGFLPGFWANKFIAIACVFLVSLSSMLRFSLLNQYANLEFASKYRATAISTLNLLVSLVFVILSFSFSFIVDKYGAGLIMTILGVLTIFTTIPATTVLLKKHNGSRS